ncbi:MAG: hypothetical protein FIB01_05980 [Gemmatimonadetes bacterium]|nr:hypothetical protein [Gemmatimonadota bacterium]
MEHDARGLEARLATLREQVGPASFDPGFSDRVMSRLARQPSLADGLQVMFFRLAPLAAAAVLLLSTANLVSTRSSGRPFLDRLLQLPAVDLTAALTADTGLVISLEDAP